MTRTANRRWCLARAAAPSEARPAARLIGLTQGAEVDVIVYLTTRYFGLASFGALYGGILTALSIGTAGICGGL